jgi:hypothetical protein
LPPSYGATPLSTIINAQAAYIAASGDFLESAANARLTNSLAANQEMENSVKWVHTYFERKSINREATKTPNYIERQETINQLTKSFVDSNYEVELKGDVSDKLNWMLRELNAIAPVQYFTIGGQSSLVDGPTDVKLSSADIHLIQFTDGGQANAQKLIFRADSMEALTTRWPRILRAPEFDQARTRFEWTRNEAVAELKASDEISHKTGQKLMDDLDALSHAFNSAYPRERRSESLETHNAYTAGKKYLQSLALGVFRLVETEDQRAFDGSFQFQGDSVADLVGHMHRNGLEFAPTGPGSEGVYHKLFFAMREFYRRLSRNP